MSKDYLGFVPGLPVSLARLAKDAGERNSISYRKEAIRYYDKNRNTIDRRYENQNIP
jgi:hypothetical protein